MQEQTVCVPTAEFYKGWNIPPLKAVTWEIRTVVRFSPDSSRIWRLFKKTKAKVEDLVAAAVKEAFRTNTSLN